MVRWCAARKARQHSQRAASMQVQAVCWRHRDSVKHLLSPRLEAAADPEWRGCSGTAHLRRPALRLGQLVAAQLAEDGRQLDHQVTVVALQRGCSTNGGLGASTAGKVHVRVQVSQQAGVRKVPAAQSWPEAVPAEQTGQHACLLQDDLQLSPAPQPTCTHGWLCRCEM